MTAVGIAAAQVGEVIRRCRACSPSRTSGARPGGDPPVEAAEPDRQVLRVRNRQPPVLAEDSCQLGLAEVSRRLVHALMLGTAAAGGNGFIHGRRRGAVSSVGRVLRTLAIENYRSLRRLVLPLTSLNVVTGANGTGKSSLYRALRLLADGARNGMVAALAREGGLQSTLWAGPEQIGRAVREGRYPVQGTARGGQSSRAEARLRRRTTSATPSTSACRRRRDAHSPWTR